VRVLLNVVVLEMETQLVQLELGLVGLEELGLG
jgi:hypothetical protein